MVALTMPTYNNSPRFALDAHLGSLARYLRMLGFDAYYENGVSDQKLVYLARREQRILLSRDRQLLAQKVLSTSYFVDAEDSQERLSEVVQQFCLCQYICPFTRCMVCNAFLRMVPKKVVEKQLPQTVRESFDEFQQCPFCRRIYWKGSHYERMSRLIARLC